MLRARNQLVVVRRCLAECCEKRLVVRAKLDEAVATRELDEFVEVFRSLQGLARNGINQEFTRLGID